MAEFARNRTRPAKDAGVILVIDQGTTSTRAIVFGHDAEPVASAQAEFPQIYPRPGWVEHDPETLWETTLSTAREALKRAACEAKALAAIGIANQRETVLVWERASGKPIMNAIVWQDRRTAGLCATLLWRLTNGAVHATDATNASRTMLYDIRAGAWDEGMLRLFRVPRAILPEVRDTAGEFGTSAPEHLSASVPIRAMIGDQQSALIGQACVEPGMVKATYGTGAFLLINIGDKPARSRNRLLTTIAYQWRGRRTYALEGSIFSAGATVQWLRDGLQIIAAAPEAGERAAKAASTDGVYCVPAFAGLGAPYWSSDARALICGLTRGTSGDVIARAALESVGYQTRDLIEAMAADAGQAIGVIRVDGGMAASDWTMQFVADMGAVPVDRPANLESTALGAAFAAGWQAGLYPGPESFAERRRGDRVFTPAMDEATREALYRGWREAVKRAL